MKKSGDSATGRRHDEDGLVRQHLPLVHYAVAEIASRLPRHINRDDLVSAGMIGLAQAARSFDGDRGIRFDRYAATRIKGALLDELRSADWASRSVRSRSRRVNEATDRLTASLGRAPSSQELASDMGMALSEIEAVADDVHRALVLNVESLMGDGSGDELFPDVAPSPDELLLDQERRAYLIDAVALLPERLRTVVVAYFLDEQPMQEIAATLEVSESRISQMRAEALALLKEGIDSQLEPESVDTEATGRVARRKAAYFSAIADRRNALGRLAGPATLGSLAAASA
jgi:RNA polymerase sigma factor for flagellar operon FliA